MSVLWLHIPDSDSELLPQAGVFNLPIVLANTISLKDTKVT